MTRNIQKKVSECTDVAVHGGWVFIQTCKLNLNTGISFDYIMYNKQMSLHFKPPH